MIFHKHVHDSKNGLKNSNELNNLNSEVVQFQRENERLPSINQQIMNVKIYEVVQIPTMLYQWYEWMLLLVVNQIDPLEIN